MSWPLGCYSGAKNMRIVLQRFIASDVTWFSTVLDRGDQASIKYGRVIATTSMRSLPLLLFLCG